MDGRYEYGFSSALSTNCVAGKSGLILWNARIAMLKGDGEWGGDATVYQQYLHICLSFLFFFLSFRDTQNSHQM